jgi:hypothetical protein
MVMHRNVMDLHPYSPVSEFRDYSIPVSKEHREQVVPMPKSLRCLGWETKRKFLE